MHKNAKTLVLAALTTGVVAIACGDKYALLEGQPCPCTAGFRCCNSSGSGNSKEQSCSKYCEDKDVSDDDDDTTSASSSGTDPYRVSAAVRKLTYQDSPLCLTADPTTVYWMNASITLIGGSTVETSKSTSRSNPPPSPAPGSCAMARSGNGVYVAVNGLSGLYWFSVAFTDATPTLGEQLVKVASVESPTALVQDDLFLYVLEGTTGNVRRFEKQSGDAGAIPGEGTVVGTGSINAHSLILDGETFYWFDDGGLRKMAKTGGATSIIATVAVKTPTNDGGSVPFEATDLQAGGGNLYWLERTTLMTVPIAGGVAHGLSYQPAQTRKSKSTTSTSTKSGDDDDTTTTTSSSGEGRDPAVYSLAVTSQGLYLAHGSTIGLLPHQGGEEKFVFRFIDEDVYRTGISKLRFDTSRFIWIGEDQTSISYRPLLETDPKL